MTAMLHILKPHILYFGTQLLYETLYYIGESLVKDINVTVMKCYQVYKNELKQM